MRYGAGWAEMTGFDSGPECCQWHWEGWPLCWSALCAGSMFLLYIIGCLCVCAVLPYSIITNSNNSVIPMSSMDLFAYCVSGLANYP